MCVIRQQQGQNGVSMVQGATRNRNGRLSVCYRGGVCLMERMEQWCGIECMIFLERSRFLYNNLPL